MRYGHAATKCQFCAIGESLRAGRTVARKTPAQLAESARAIKDATGLPIQGQCEPPADFGWFPRLRAAGVDTLGMHLEAWDEDVRARIMPGKAEVPVSFYLEAFATAVAVFGRGQVSTYLLAGLGDTAAGCSTPHAG